MKKLITVIFFALLFPAILGAQSLTIKLSTTDVTCNGNRDGEVDCNILSGTGPFTYLWSNGATTANITQLATGYYHVTVYNGTDIAEDGVNINEPEKISAEFTASDYTVNGRHYNISLAGACNGYINSSVTGGVGSYTYHWDPYNQTTANITNVCAGQYNFVVTDGNGCSKAFPQPMNEPDKDSWSMTGAANTNPPSQFIGTTDNKDFVFKTNNNEALRIKGNGQLQFVKGTLKIDTAATDSARVVYVDQNGVLKTILGTGTIGLPTFPWQIGGNNNINDQTNYIGPVNNQDFIIKTGTGSFSGTNNERVRVTKTGDVTIKSLVGSVSGFVTTDANGTLGRLSFSTTSTNVLYGNGSWGALPVGSSLWETSSNNVNNINNTNYLHFVGINCLPLTSLQVESEIHATFISAAREYNNPAELNHGTSYIGFNAVQVLNSSNNGYEWHTEDISSGNGGNIIFGNIAGDMNFATIPSTPSGGQQAISNTSLYPSLVRMKIRASDGAVGIGTVNPSTTELLDVNGNAKVQNLKISSMANSAGDVVVVGTSGGQLTHLNAATSGLGLWNACSNNTNNIINANAGYVQIGGTSCAPKTTLDIRGRLNLEDSYGTAVIYFPQTHSGGWPELHFRSSDNPGGTYSPFSEKMIIKADGSVYIYGSLHIDAPLPPDFVFEKDYNRIPWQEKETFYQNNCHLPYIAPGGEMKSEGLDVGKNFNGLLQNVEEDRLDLSDLFKRMEKVENQNIELIKQNENLKKEIEQLKK